MKEKYLVEDRQRDGNGDVFTDYYDTKSEAVDAAEHDWDYFTKYEKRDRIITVERITQEDLDDDAIDENGEIDWSGYWRSEAVYTAGECSNENIAAAMIAGSDHSDITDDRRKCYYHIFVDDDGTINADGRGKEFSTYADIDPDIVPAEDADEAAVLAFLDDFDDWEDYDSCGFGDAVYELKTAAYEYIRAK